MQALIKKNKEHLDEDQKKIIEGILDLQNTNAGQIMIPLANAFIIDGNRFIDMEIIRDIYTQG